MGGLCGGAALGRTASRRRVEREPLLNVLCSLRGGAHGAAHMETRPLVGLMAARACCRPVCVVWAIIHHIMTTALYIACIHTHTDRGTWRLGTVYWMSDGPDALAHTAYTTRRRTIQYRKHLLQIHDTHRFFSSALLRCVVPVPVFFCKRKSTCVSAAHVFRRVEARHCRAWREARLPQSRMLAAVMVPAGTASRCQGRRHVTIAHACAKA